MTRLLKIFTAVSVVLFAGSGCKKWLDVNPSDQVSAGNLFKDPEGYHSALNGIYQMMASPDLYGCELTWGMNSALSQDYGEFFCGNHDIFLSYKFSDINIAAPIITSVWKAAFHAIANCNKLAESVAARDSSFFNLRNAEKQMILGEAMASRALLHFEMLRLFAPPVTSDPGAKILPYADKYPNYVPTYLTSKEVVDKITADLRKAQELLAPIDTIVNRDALAAGKGSAVMPKGGIHFNYRRNRLNYVAVQALLARVYLYAGNYPEASKAAEHVYKRFSQDGVLQWWRFNPEFDFNSSNQKDNIMSEDLITSFYDSELDQHVKEKRGLDFMTYALSTYDLPQWYPDAERDYRKYLIKADFSSEKWMSKAVRLPATNIPVLRMSEVYYIYSECLFKEGKINEAMNVLNNIRIARGKLDFFHTSDEQEFYNELLAEYRREYITEGQIFFAHKRLGRSIVTVLKQVEMDSKVILPVPDGEKFY